MQKYAYKMKINCAGVCVCVYPISNFRKMLLIITKLRGLEDATTTKVQEIFAVLRCYVAYIGS